jgi:hypothetical protein
MRFDPTPRPSLPFMRTLSITISSSSTVSILRNHAGHSVCPSGSTTFEQTVLALATLNHARSFAAPITRGQGSTTDRSIDATQRHVR